MINLLLRQRPHGARAQGPQRAGGEPAQQRAACQRAAAAARAARPAASASSATAASCRSPRSARRSCSAGSARRRSVHPPCLPVAGRPPISRSSSSSCRTPCPPTATTRTRRGSARSAISSACSSTCAARPDWRKSALPFDTVFIVNRFLGAVSQAVLESGGMPNQFVGDGMLALFGLSTTRQEACRQALTRGGR